MSGKLSLLENSSDSEVELTINKDYANRYDRWRHQEELQKYKDLKKDEEDSESSSESEEEIDEDFDEEFFRALSLLKGKDPRIYDKNFSLFQEKEKIKKIKNAKPKPIYMKDYERNLVLERGGKLSDDDDEEENLPEKIPTYDEEQENLKKSFKEAVGGSDDSDYDDLLHVRNKTKKEEEDAETDYVKWLKGEEKDVPENVKKDMSYLRNYWNDPKLDEDEKFLRDYILNKRYLEKDDSEIPTYEELTSGMLSDDEKIIEEQEKFEHKYNFRFEEPDEEFIKRYPRTVGDSLRRVDNRRKQKREEKTERKNKEREQRREELKRLKALKRKEIEEKFMKLKEISGQDEININESDIESDFDPDKHDQKMREMFNDEYYQVEEDKKPEFPYDEELDSENWNTWTGEKSSEGEDQEEERTNENTCNQHESSESKSSAKDDFANEMINACRPKKKVKKKSLFAKIVSQPKPIYDPSGKSFEDYLDEYYKLDYEDVVGDMPVRYKYRKVIANDFGLTVDEILSADDRELNRWCSVKKTCQYRNDDEELYDVQAFQKKAGNPLSKKKFLPSIYAAKDNSVEVVDSDAKGRETLSGEVITIDKSFNKVDDQEDVSQGRHEKAQTANGNLDSSMQVNVSSKKSRKKKRKLNTSISENETEPTDHNRSNVCDLSNFNLVNNSEIDKDIMQSQEESKKSKKKKQKEKMVISDIKNKYENSNEVEDSDAFVTESCASVDDKHTQRKRKHIENSLSDSKVDQEVASDDSSPKSKKCVSDFNIVTKSNSNLVSEHSSETTLKKKKKKKKNKRKGNMSNNNKTNMQDNISNLSLNKFKGKYKKHTAEDKRLGLSDERLAAYGINPKKFKNRIIYSKK